MEPRHDRAKKISTHPFFVGCVVAILMVAGLTFVGCQGQVVSNDNPPEQTFDNEKDVLQTTSSGTGVSSAVETQNDQQEFMGAIEYDGAPCH
jgi:hypothetical protein